MSHATYITGDVRDVLAAMPDGSVDLVLTSPPFLALRSYLPADHPDKHREIGAEPGPAEFIDTLLGLTAEWRRVLAPHGSIAIELGDTYAGSGGGGGDYLPGGIREGQQQFAGSAATMRESNAAHWRAKHANRDAWPLDKSLTLIPELYRVALAYGINPLTGTASPAERWRARNVVRWCRPNPPVGALGDKVRPATSDMVIGCTSRTRYFDLDAIRTPHKSDPAKFTGNGYTKGNPSGEGEDSAMPGNAVGAPPLDHWWADPDDDWFEQDAWLVSTEAYRGSHYATWPRKLLTRPILAMCPEKVCTTCGEPSRRIVERAPSPADGRTRDPVRMADFGGERHGDRVSTATTVGWTDCGHGSYRCQSCHVVVPSDHALRRSRESQGSEAAVGGKAVLDEPIEGARVQADDARGLPAMRDRVHGPVRGTMLHPELFGQVGPRGGQGEHDPTEDDRPRQTPHVDRLRPTMGARVDARPPEERPHDGASAGHAGASWPSAGVLGDRPSPQRSEGRQSVGEPGDRDPGPARRHGDVPSLPGDLQGQLGGYVCPCGSRDIEYVGDHWRPGVVLDPFAGSGTTLAVATGHGRDAIGIDFDVRNVDLALERVGPLYLSTLTLAEYAARLDAA